MSEEARSKALEYIDSKGLTYRPAGSDQAALETCPFCGNHDFKFYINVSGDKKDGLFDCKTCQENGNLWKLKTTFGDRIEGVQSIRELAQGQRAPEALPNFALCHANLLNDSEALDYLMCERGYSKNVIEQMQLGVMRNFFKKGGEQKCIVIPYLKNDKCVYAKYRTIPPAAKEFDSPHGHEASLYNDAALSIGGLKELIITEGEGDVLCLLSNGVSYVVGVPGADVKKAAWITLLDRLRDVRIYLLYDLDKPGQDGAYKMANRIGLSRCHNIVLPEFTYVTDDGDEKQGKDANEWFRHGGGTVEKLEALKLQARKFDVAGVSGVGDALSRLKSRIIERGSLQREFDTPWKSGNDKGMGGERGNLIVILAEEKRGKTTLALNWSDYLWASRGMSGAFFCLEMSDEELARKWACSVTMTDDSPPKSDAESVTKAVVLLKAIDDALEIARNRERGDLLFGYSRGNDVDEVFDMMEQAIRRYGLDYIVFDNLQLFADSTLRNLSQRTAHLSQIGKRFKKLATDHGIFVILIVQPHRVQDGKIVDANNADGGSQIQKDCDQFITMHRNLRGGMTADDFAKLGHVDIDLAFDPQTLMSIARSRSSGGGKFTLWCDGAMSLFREFSDVERGQLPKVSSGGGGLSCVPQEGMPKELALMLGNEEVIEA